MPELVAPSSTNHVLASTANLPVDQQVVISVTTDPPVGVLLDAEGIENSVEKSLHLMCALIVSWNLTKDGQPLEITAATLRQLSPALFANIFGIINGLASEVQAAVGADAEKKV